jgi:hypothetical protein
MPRSREWHIDLFAFFCSCHCLTQSPPGQHDSSMQLSGRNARQQFRDSLDEAWVVCDCPSSRSYKCGFFSHGLRLSLSPFPSSSPQILSTTASSVY